MSAADWALVALVPTLLLYLGYQWGKAVGERDAKAKVRDLEAARRTIAACYDSEVREHDRTRRAWADERASVTPIYDRLAERRDGFERTADEIRRLPEAGA